MAKVKKCRLRWKASSSPQVVGYKLYWSSGGVDYTSNSVKLGNVTEIVLPDDVPDFAHLDGPIELGIAAVDEVGNESDLTILKTPFQFTVPQAPSDLWLETLKGSPGGPAATREEAGAAEPENGGGLRNLEQDLAGLYQNRFALPTLANLRRDRTGPRNPTDPRACRTAQKISPYLDQNR